MLLLSHETRENRAEIKEMQQVLDSLANSVERLTYDIRRIEETEKFEREKLAMQLEIALLRFERRLLPDKAVNTDEQEP